MSLSSSSDRNGRGCVLNRRKTDGWTAWSLNKRREYERLDGQEWEGKEGTRNQKYQSLLYSLILFPVQRT